MKLNLVRFAALAAVSWLGMCPASRADFTFQIQSQNDGSVATFLAEGASNIADYSYNPGNLILESVTNGSGLNASLGSVTIQLDPFTTAQQPINIVVLPNASGSPVILEGGTYTFDNAVISSSLVSSVLSPPTWNIDDAVKVETNWTRNLSAPEPLSILGAAVALGFGIALKQYKRRLAA